MHEKILFVDDEPRILAGYERTLRQHFSVETAVGPEAGLQAIQQRGPFAVIVSDLRMPGMDGVQFLEAAKTRSPDTVRIMLTGNADLESAAQAVNQGNIFRFLTKPCPPDVLSKALQDALQQHRLVTAERELLEKTLSGTIRVLTDLLSAVDPHSFDRAVALKQSVHTLATALKVENVWQVEAAAMLAQVGLVTVPSSIIQKTRSGIALTQIERDILQRVPDIGRNLLANIPRLEPVAEIVFYQSKNFDGSGFPADAVAGESIPIGARALKVLNDLTELKCKGASLEKAFQIMRAENGCYDLHVLETAHACFVSVTPAAPQAAKLSRPVRIDELQLGQSLLSDVQTTDGTLLISAGREITEAVLERIRNFAQMSGIKEPILIDASPVHEKHPAACPAP